MSRYLAIKEQIVSLEKEAAKLLEEGRAKAIAEIKTTMELHGLTIADLRNKRGPRKAK